MHVSALAFGLSAALSTGAVAATLEGTVTGAKGATLAVVYVEKIDHPKPRPDAMKAIIRQKDTEFVPAAVAIMAGGEVVFPNEDSISHNAFSYSAGSKFDTGVYPKGESKSVPFKNPGEIDVFCNIHESMTAKVLVLQNELFAPLKPDGSFRISGVPAGKWVVIAWSNRHRPERKEVEVKGDETLKLAFKLAPRAEAGHLNKEGKEY